MLVTSLTRGTARDRVNCENDDIGIRDIACGLGNHGIWVSRSPPPSHRTPARHSAGSGQSSDRELPPWSRFRLIPKGWCLSPWPALQCVSRSRALLDHGVVGFEYRNRVFGHHRVDAGLERRTGKQDRIGTAVDHVARMGLKRFVHTRHDDLWFRRPSGTDRHPSGC